MSIKFCTSFLILKIIQNLAKRMNKSMFIFDVIINGNVMHLAQMVSEPVKLLSHA